MDSRGFTLIEALMAVAVLGVAMAGMLPTFMTFLDANSISEERSGAVAAAQLAMEGLRQQDPGGMPSTGSSSVDLVTVGDRDFEVQSHYCQNTTYCSTDTRHIVLEVSFGGQTVYSVETVLTALR